VTAAVVGTGFIGVVHVEALRRLGVEVVGVVGSSPERAAAKPGLPEPYPSFEAMLDDERVRVVHITSPNHLHFDHARAVLEAGKHVVCEKPLAMDSSQTGELLELARRSGLVHAVNFNIRFYPQVQEAAARVASGDLGDVHLVSGGYLQDWLLLDTDWNWRLDPSQGGTLRAVGDIGSHWLDLMTFVTASRVEAVMAELVTVVPVRREPAGPVETFAGANGGETIERRLDTEDLAGMLLRFENGARGVVAVSQVSAGRKNSLSFEVDGASGALAWFSEQPEQLWLGHRGRPNELLTRDPSLMHESAAATAALPAGHVEGFADTFKELYRAVYRDVAAGRPAERPDYPTFEDGHDEALIADAVAQSAREGGWTTVRR
jgi:predicted dehydrogenase